MQTSAFRRWALAACGLTLTLAATALPAQRGVWRRASLSDGQTLLVQSVGDEHFHYFTDADGNAYARQAGGNLAVLTEAQLRAAADVLAPVRDVRAAQRAARRGPHRSPQTGDPVADLHGQRRGLVVLVSFRDTRFADDHTPAFYERVFNERGFAEAPFHRSVRDYFLEQSRGQFDLEFDIVGPVTLSREAAYYGENLELSTLLGSTTYEGHVADLAVEAIQLAAPTTDFSRYDWDGDGTVEQVCFLYAGQGEATGGAPETVWPVESSLSAMASQPRYFPDAAVQEFNGVRIDAFAATNELNNVIATAADGRRYYSDELRVAGIGAFCHEFGHCLGLPDFYYSTSSPVGYWDIMDSGEHLDGGFQPCAYTAYERWFCGWQTPVELTGTTEVKNLRPLADGGDTYVFYCDNPSRTEYFLFENRQRVGTDGALLGHGLLVSHVDYDAAAWAAHTVNRNTSNYHQRMTFLHANRNNDITEEASAGHLYPFEGKDSITINNFPRFAQYNGTHRSSLITDRAVRGITENADLTMDFIYEVGEQVDYSAVPALRPSGENAASVLFDLGGRPVGGAARRGVYVSTGRKVVR